jgi:anthranilate phosphoribosyltransferase
VNAGAALFVSGKAENLAAGINLANKVIDSGAALSKLKELVNAAGEPEKLARFL